MGLTPVEILNKEFDKRFRGYDEEQVNDYLDLIVSEFERLLQDNAELTRKLADTQEKLRYFEQLQDSLNNSIIVANEAAERLKQNARKEAELILFEAEREADRLVLDANGTVQRIAAENEEIKRSTRQFHESLQRMLLSQLDILSQTHQDVFSESMPLNAVERSNYGEQTQHLNDRVAELEQQVVVSEPERVEVEQFVTEEVQADEFNVDSIPSIEEVLFGENNSLEDRYIPEENEGFRSHTLDLRELLAQLPTEVPNDIPSTPTGESVMGRTMRIDLPE